MIAASPLQKKMMAIDPYRKTIGVYAHHRGLSPNHSPLCIGPYLAKGPPCA